MAILKKYNTDTAQWESVAIGTTGYTGSQGAIGYTGSAASGGSGSGVTTYATVGDLPVSASGGDLAYVTATNGLYIWNGSIWFLILTATTPNDAPYITQGPELGYLLATDGTPTVITLAAQDPESTPITWSYTITSGTLGNTAVISNTNNVFTITPSTNSADAGQFEVTFTASDGVNIANARTYVRLRFATIDYAIGLQAQNTLLPSGFSSAANARFGRSVSATGGIVAIAGAGKYSGNLLVDPNTNTVSLYSALNGTSLTFLQEITAPSGISSFGENNIAVWSDMLVVPGYFTGNTASEDKRTFHVYYRTSGTWALTQTIEFTSTITANVTPMSINGAQPLAISGSGLIMACASPATDSDSGAVELRIYSRASTSTTTWTLRQTLAGTISGITDYDYFPNAITISTTGKHIAFTSRNNDEGGIDTGKVLILTNADLASNIFSWIVTGNLVAGVGRQLSGAFLTNTTKSDDIFYLLSDSITGGTTILEMIKYVSGTATWDRYSYSSVLGLHHSSKTANVSLDAISQARFAAIPGRDNTSEVIFVSSATDKIASNIVNLVTTRVKNYDLTLVTPIGSDNSGVDSNVSMHVNAIRVPNTGNLTIDSLLPYISIDQQAGQVYVGTRGTYSGVSNSGGVTQYVPIGVTANTTAYSKTWYNPTTNELMTTANPDVTDTVVVRPGQNYLHAICVGGGGSGAGDNTSPAPSGGGGGGGLRWITNYPVSAGDVITITAGSGAPRNAGAANGSTGNTSSVTINGVTVLSAFGGGGGVSATNGGGGGGGGGSTTGTLSNGSIIGGGNGGPGGAASAGGNTTFPQSGGGGAGGYAGAGGAGANGAAATAGSGGAGGGGGGPTGGSYVGGYGGGVGLYGIGANGASGGTTNGSPGSFTDGLDYNPGNINATALSRIGAGGGGTNAGATTSAGFDQRAGGGGAVRIILGDRYVIGSNLATTSSFIRPPTYTGT